MHPNIRSLSLTMAIALLSLVGLSIFRLNPSTHSISLNQSSNSDLKSEADRLAKKGFQYFQLSKFQSTLQYWQKALEIYRKVKDRRGEGNALGGLGIVYDALGDYRKAIELHQEYLTITRKIKDRHGEGVALGNLGNAYYSLNIQKTCWEIKSAQGQGFLLIF
jgi:tetratricopeptide (TPR) repeat protein